MAKRVQVAEHLAMDELEECCRDAREGIEPTTKSSSFCPKAALRRKHQRWRAAAAYFW